MTVAASIDEVDTVEEAAVAADDTVAEAGRGESSWSSRYEGEER